MIRIKIDRYRVSVPVLKRVVDALNDGAVVVFPTETSYGLAADPANPRAIRRIYAIKGRRAEKQLPLIAGRPVEASSAVRLSGLALKLAKKYWPGPLTIVAPLTPKGRRLLGGKAATAAIRVPASVWARAIARGLGHPITSTSANLSGQPAVYDPAGIRLAFVGRRQPDIFLDAGKLPPRPPSTIVRVRGSRIITLRPGPIRL